MLTQKLTNNEIQLLNEFGLDLQTPDLIAKIEEILKEESELGKVFYTELIGLKKEQKLEMLEKMEYQNLDWQELKPKDNYYFFVPKDFSKSEEYD